jgi:hypothetical protein
MRSVKATPPTKRHVGQVRSWLVPALCTLLFTACGTAGPGGDSGAKPGSMRVCQGEERVMLDCSSEVSYQGAKGEAEISVMQIGSA